MSFKRWVLTELDKESAAQLAEECELHPFLALLLTTRGISDPAEADAFLVGGEPGDDPFGFADMVPAVERVQRALDAGERMAVFGDYDADGVTATALLYSYLRDRQADVLYRIPKREGEGEGYGLRRETVDWFAEQGVRLIITVDNGIAAVEEIDYARSRGMDVVVTDHHQPQERLPEAAAVVNPHRADCGSEYKEYAGVGVAFKLASALEGDADAVLEQYGDLIALGTLADVMPLTGENRLLVREGLQQLAEGKRPGLRALAEEAGVSERAMTASTALFSLAPRLNAAGRMGEPEKAERLLLAESAADARALAEEIQRMNVRRQEVEGAILEEALRKLREQPDCRYQRVLVVAGQGWHPGVVGIIAARLLDRFGKPCIVLSVEERPDGTRFAKGSGRSLPGFPLFEAIAACGGLLDTFGGHELAAGVGLDAGRIDVFRRQINDWAAVHYPVMPAPQLAIDFKLRPSQVDVEKLQLIAALEPFGNGNPAPVFQLSGMRLENITPVGGGRHLRLSLSRDGTMVSAMKFQTAPEDFPVPCGALLHLAVTLERNEFRGVVSPSVIVKDLRYADTVQEEMLAGLADYDRLMRRERPSDPAACTPSRDQIAALYRLLRARGGWRGTLEQLLHAVDAMSCVQLRVAAEVLCEAGLASAEDDGDRLCLSLLPASGKADLNDTPLMRFLHEVTAV